MDLDTSTAREIAAAWEADELALHEVYEQMICRFGAMSDNDINVFLRTMPGSIMEFLPGYVAGMMPGRSSPPADGWIRMRVGARSGLVPPPDPRVPREVAESFVAAIGKMYTWCTKNCPVALEAAFKDIEKWQAEYGDMV